MLLITFCPTQHPLIHLMHDLISNYYWYSLQKDFSLKKKSIEMRPGMLYMIGKIFLYGVRFDI